MGLRALGRRIAGRPPRLIAMLAFRDEARFLPGFFRNVAPQVDGIVCLDDGSTDSSAELAAGEPAVLEVLERKREGESRWNDSVNHRMLVEASWRHDADWLIGLDADERVERHFRARAMREIERARREGHSAYFVGIRELWDRPDTYRADGLWTAKRSARLFESRRDHLFDERELHGHWAPLNDYPKPNSFPLADILVYHLRMMRAEDRRARQARYERLDPHGRWQAFGYSYMSDLTGLRLERLAPGREYEPLGI